MTVEQTLAELVRIDSVSSRSNAEMVSYLSTRVEAAGFSVRHFPYADGRGVEKTNMVAIAGASSFDVNIELALVGHTDVVPFDAKWTNALSLTERDGKLY